MKQSNIGREQKDQIQKCHTSFDFLFSMSFCFCFLTQGLTRTLSYIGCTQTCDLLPQPSRKLRLQARATILTTKSNVHT